MPPDHKDSALDDETGNKGVSDDGPPPPVAPEVKAEKTEQKAKEEEPVVAAAPHAQKRQEQEDNEFILDGFDFSTSVSICQALDLDEDEPSTIRYETEHRSSHTPSSSATTTPSKPIKDPSELGNALLKALGVDKEKASSEVTQASQHYRNSTISSTSTGRPRVVFVTKSHPL